MFVSSLIWMSIAADGENVGVVLQGAACGVQSYTGILHYMVVHRSCCMYGGCRFDDPVYPLEIIIRVPIRRCWGYNIMK